ncbi:MAG: PorT family protein [Bacteroidales bacterium]|nr:PorT family protein [Bacteroidales bacterium]
MKKDIKNIDKLFKDILKGYKEKTPIYAWDKLNNDLHKSNKIINFSYTKWAAASVAILLAFITGYYIAKYNFNTEVVSYNPPQQQDNLLTDNSISEDFSVIEPIENKSDNLNIKDEKIYENKINTNTSDLKNKNKPETDVIKTPLSDITKNDTKHKTNDIALKKEPSIKQIKKINNDISQKHLETVNAINNKNLIEQFDIPKTKNTSRWTVGGQFSPIYSYRDIKQDGEIKPPLDNDMNTNYYDNVEEGLLSFAGGLSINYQVKNKWSIQSGVYYSKIGQVNTDALTYKYSDNTFYLYSINTSTGFFEIKHEDIPSEIDRIPQTKDSLDVASLMESNIIQNFEYFEIPLLIKFKVIDKRIDINLLGGISTGILTGNNSYIEHDQQKHEIGKIENLNTFIYSSTIAIGFEYKILKKLSVNMEPTFKYSLRPINKDNTFKYFPYSFAWFTGLNYTL